MPITRRQVCSWATGWGGWGGVSTALALPKLALGYAGWITRLLPRQHSGGYELPADVADARRRYFLAAQHHRIDKRGIETRLREIETRVTTFFVLSAADVALAIVLQTPETLIVLPALAYLTVEMARLHWAVRSKLFFASRLESFRAWFASGELSPFGRAAS